MVPGAGIEPARPLSRKILSPLSNKTVKDILYKSITYALINGLLMDSKGL